MKQIRLIGPDERSEIVGQTEAFWDWLFSYCEEAGRECRIAGLRWRWAFGLFAVDPHVGGISRAQFGRAIGRHPGHAGREIDGDTPGSNARDLMAANFRMEEVADGSGGIDCEGED